MRLHGLLSAALLVAFLPSTSGAMNLYVGDSVGTPVKACVPVEDGIGGTPQPTFTHHLWMDAGSGVATFPCDGTTDLASTTVCMYDVHLMAGSGITFESVTDVAPGLVRTPDVQLSSGELRMNAGDPILGQNLISEIAAVEMSSLVNDTVTLEGVMWVSTDLVGNPLGPSIEVFHSGIDTDQDGLCDERDPCPDFANTLTGLATTGIPAECLCGDADGNGQITSTDLVAMNVCVQNNSLCDQGLVDANNDGATTSTDIIATNTVVNGAPLHSLRCGRRPSGLAPQSDAN